MKNLILLLFFLMSAIAFSQGESTLKNSLPLIKLDFNNPKKITIPKKIKVGDFYRIKVKNINLNQYYVSLKASDTTYSKALEFPTFGKIDLSGLVDLSSPLIATFASNTTSDSEINDLAVNANYTHANILYKSMISNKILSYSYLTPQRSDTKKQLIDKQIGENSIKALEFSTKLKMVKKEIDEKDFNYMEARILRKTDKINTSSIIDIKADLKVFKQLRDDLETLRKEIEVSIKKFKDFVDNEAGIKAFLLQPRNITLKENFDKSKSQLELALKKTNQIIDVISTKNIEKIIVSIMNLYDKTGYTSLPIQLNEEEAEVEIFFIPKDSTSNLQKYSLSPIRFPVKKSYWSVGASMYYSGMKSERVSYETIAVNDSVSRTKVWQEDATNGEFGTALLLRAGCKIDEDNNIGAHFTVGTGISISEDILPRALLGAGLSIGKKHSVTFDIGANIGNTKVISKNIDFDKEYIEKPDVLINKIDISYFLAIGYQYNL
ncbi:hypothetical protein N9V96_03495 [Polaribacter sp.]|nr:hypothetical protein [Polaribacter sp.]